MGNAKAIRWSSDQGIFPQTVRAQILKAFERLEEIKISRNYAEASSQPVDSSEAAVFHFHYCLSHQSLHKRQDKEIYIRILPEAEAVAGIKNSTSNQDADFITSGNLSVVEWMGILDLLRRYSHRVESSELSEISATIGQLMNHLREDLTLLEGLHRSRLPKRFPKVKGMEVRSRYLAGLKPGGDFFDLAESEDGMRLHFVLTDASSYSLSSAVLSVLMRVALKIAPGEGGDPAGILKRISGEMMQVMKEKENLSICFGSISRKDWKLRLVHHGTNQVLLFRKSDNPALESTPNNSFQMLTKPNAPLKKATIEDAFQNTVEVSLNPEDQLFILSDGWEEAVGGAKQLEKILLDLDLVRTDNLEDGLTALVYEAKRRRESPDDLPAQDCSVLAFKLEARLLKLASEI